LPFLSSGAEAAESSHHDSDIPLEASLSPLLEFTCCSQHLFCRQDSAPTCPTCGRIFPVHGATDDSKQSDMPLDALAANEVAHVRPVPFGPPAPRCVVIKTTYAFSGYDQFIERQCVYIDFILIVAFLKISTGSSVESDMMRT
jgi:hypothetical protein